MNCYLKISYLNRHKKYRYWRDRPINFQQIKRELLVNLPSECICYILNNKSSSKGQNIEEAPERKMSEQELSDYIKAANLTEKETIKIKIIEDNSKIKTQRKSSEEDMDSYAVPLAVDRLRSKSEEISIETVNVEIKTDTIEFTQEFLCNSNIEFAENVKKQTELDWIVRQLEANSRKMRQLQEKKRLTYIPSLYQKMRSERPENDMHQHL